MLSGHIEEIVPPKNCLDVLAQQIVSMCAERPWGLTELETVVRRAAPYHGLSRDALVSVLDMLAGRYPSSLEADLRPRIVWDLSLIHISEPTRQAEISYAVFCL